VPIYHIPCGNENLLAREFGMDRSVTTLRRAIRQWRLARVDVGLAADRGRAPVPFVLMCGIGPDAGVVERLTMLRTRAIGHLAYVEPVIREVLSPRLPVMHIQVDGEPMVQGVAGMLIVANCRQYGFRLDPAHLASMTDGALDAVFMPCTTSVGALRWLGRAGRRRMARFSQLRYWRGREIVVRAERDAPFQLDGDPPGAPGLPRNGHVPGAGVDLRLSVRPGALAVLAP
jgi:diacylglycerol kinase family enzyme